MLIFLVALSLYSSMFSAIFTDVVGSCSGVLDSLANADDFLSSFMISELLLFESLQTLFADACNAYIMDLFLESDTWVILIFLFLTLIPI